MITTTGQGLAVQVTARLTEPIVDVEQHPLMLDGPLAWAHAQVDPPSAPITRDHAPDMPLPLARWENDDGAWGWCVSAGDYTATRHTAIQLRRKPATAAMARYAPDARHHLALGPHKARDTTLPATWVDRIVWQALTTHRDRLEHLLTVVTHLGKAHAVGYGRVDSWRVEETGDTDAWTDRPLPDPRGQLTGIRAPYHHPTRRYPCSWTRRG